MKCLREMIDKLRYQNGLIHLLALDLCPSSSFSSFLSLEPKRGINTV